MTDETNYEQNLLNAGLPPEKAAAIAAKTQRRAKKDPVVIEDPASACKPTQNDERPARSSALTSVDYRKSVPAWVKDVISAHLAIEAEDAKKAGALGFMARAMVIATMPYKDLKNPDGTPKESFVRQNGDFKLKILAGYDGGIPYGTYPRLLLNWITTEAVRTQSPNIELGDSLRAFLRDVLELKSTSGGVRGTGTRVVEQMKRLFGSLITAQYAGSQSNRPFVLKNVLIADDVQIDENNALWTPQAEHEAGAWQSHVKLTENFFTECITNPVPIDLRAYKALRGSAMSMDIYTWLSYRMSYLQSPSRPISWEALMLQFGSGYGSAVTTEQGIKQAVRDFKRGFLEALKLVELVYPEACVRAEPKGLVLLPSKPHIPKASLTPKTSSQGSLF